MITNENGRSSGTVDDKLLNLRLSNVNETQKRIQRLFGLIYLLFFLIFLSWYNINFENSALEKNIDKLEKALTIEVLKPWDNFIQRTASCFHPYFFGYGRGGVFTRADLKQYIETFESENRKDISIISGHSNPYPVAKLKELLDDEDHWQDCSFWAQQDTLVFYLFRLDYYLKMYFFQRLNANYNGHLEDFLASTDSISPAVDSILCYLTAKMDSLIKPFERYANVELNPFVGLGIDKTTLWGRYVTFDDYDSYDLGNLLSGLQKLNHLSWFKHEIIKNCDILFHAQKDLERIKTQTIIQDRIRVSDNKTDSGYFDLLTILNSHLITCPNLPDSILLPRLFDLSYGELAGTIPSDTLLDVYFQAYKQVLSEFKINKFGGVRILRDDKVSQRGNAKQKIQVIGAEISSGLILYVLPILSWAFYFMVLLLMNHLLFLLKPDKYGHWKGTPAIHFRTEALKAPLFITLRPDWIAFVLILFPIPGIIFFLIFQIVSGRGHGSILNSYVVCIMILLYIFVSVLVFLRVRSLQKNAKSTYPNSLEELKKESKVDTQQHIGDNNS